MSWWAWLIIGLAAWLVVALTLIGVYAFTMTRKASKVIDREMKKIPGLAQDEFVNLGPARSGGYGSRRPTI